MARSRNIKPGFFKNEELGDLPATFRLFFIGLWCVADREGRLEDRPKRLWAELMPYDPFEGDAALEKLAARHFVVRYEANGVRCIQITNFTKHQAPHYKEVASEIPSPPGWKDSGTTPGSAPDAIRKEILERDGRCIECGSSEDLTLDHIVPRSLGGSHEEENLQTLCRRCNSAKNNRIAKNSGKRQCDDDSTSAQRRPEVGLASIGGEFTLDSWIPGFLDSLIPVSLDSVIPGEDPNPKSCSGPKTATAPAPDPGTGLALVNGSKEVATKPLNGKIKAEAKTAAIWAAYSTAYFNRYGAEPVRNAKINGQLAQVVDRLGADEAPHVAACYVASGNQFYVLRRHSVDCLLRDCESLRTEWATGTRITATEARHMDEHQTSAENAKWLRENMDNLRAARKRGEI